MSLRMVYGRAGSGKSYFCVNDIRMSLERYGDMPHILIVPEQYSLQAERNLIKMSGSGGIMKAEVLSFRRMAFRVFNEVGGLMRRYINPAGRCMLIYRIMDSRKDDFRIFSKAIKRQGFIAAVCGIIDEFKRYNITPMLLKDMAERIEDDRFLKAKLSEIHIIYSEFEKILQQRYRDANDDLTELAVKLEKSCQFDGAHIWIDGFSGFTPQEYRVMEKLLKKAQRVSVTACTDCLTGDSRIDDFDVFSPARKMAGRLLKIAAETGVYVEEPVRIKGDGPHRFSTSKELEHLERHYHSYPFEVYPHRTKDISIFTSASIYSEVEETARDIIGLCRDKGFRFGNIAVVTRNLEGYRKLVGSIFAEYGIPCFIDRKRDIGSHPLILLIQSLFEIFTTGWSYQSVFRYLKTGLTSIEREDVDIIENYVLACGIKGSRWTQDEDWNFRFNPGFEYDEAEEKSDGECRTQSRINDIRRRIVRPLAEFHRKIKEGENARETCEALFEFLCSMGVPDRIEKWITGFKETGQLDLANEYRQIWNIVMEVFDQVVEVSGEEHTGVDSFAKLLGTGFAEYSIGLIPPALDQVLVGSVERSRSHEIDALFILGVNDGIFPAVTNKEGILSDRDREKLSALGMELARDTRTAVCEEQYLIYTALATAGKYLRLSCPLADHEGRTMRPSIIISRIRKILPYIAEYSNIADGTGDADKAMPVLAAPVPAFNELVPVLRKQAEGSMAGNIWKDVYRWYAGNDAWKEKCRTVLDALSYSNLTGSIGREKVSRLLGMPLYTSISRLEAFASCPFSYYVRYGLNAQERRIFRLNPPDIGIFMHNVIRIFSERLTEKNMKWRNLEREWCDGEIASIVDELLESMSGTVLNSSQRFIYLMKRLKRVISRAVCLIAEHIGRSGFEPLGYEVDFDEHGKFPPIVLVMPGGEKIRLTGRIDRIDVMRTGDGTYFRIVDYKSGTRAFRLSDVYNGLQLQLVTYMGAISENDENGLQGPLIPGGILYFRVDDPVIRVDSRNGAGDIEKAIMKQLRMKGLLLADVKLIREMDRRIEGDSLIIPARINNGEVLGTRSSAATQEQFKMLGRYVRGFLSEIAEEMIKGDVSIKPYKKTGETSCTYCGYSSICQFDPLLKDNKYRILDDLADGDVWELIKKRQPEGENV